MLHVSFPFRYGGGFQAGASVIYNASAIVAHSVARVGNLVNLSHQFFSSSLGHTSHIRELQL